MVETGLGGGSYVYVPCHRRVTWLVRADWDFDAWKSSGIYVAEFRVRNELILLSYLNYTMLTKFYTEEREEEERT